MLKESILTRDRLVEMYQQMVLIRHFEEASAEQYARGKIAGFLHLYIGEEAVAVGAMAALRPDDHVLTHYREHGHALARGMDPKAVMAELFGKATGVSGGRGGSMHLAKVDKHFWGGYAIVSAHLPLATGLALAEQYQGTERIVTCVFGEGASNAGEFHESLNLAALWNLPVLFLVENNLYGMGTAVGRASAVQEMYRKACAYDMPGEQVDGMNVLAVFHKVSERAERIRRGGGPALLEAMTYRFRGHSMADPARYRQRAEVEEFQQTDPIKHFQDYLKMRVTISADHRATDGAEAARFLGEVKRILQAPANLLL